MANKYSISTAFNLIDNITKPLDKIGISGKSTGNILKKGFLEAQDRVSNFGKTLNSAVGYIKKATIAATGFATAAAGAFVAKGFKDALEYDTALRKVSTVADTAAVSMDTLSQGLMKVSNETGTAVAELAELQYNAIVSGIKTADSVTFVEAAVKAADASFSDTGVVIESLTAVLNAYKMEASEATKIAGQMLIANNSGVTSFDELNNTLGKILPTASQLNVGTDELFASITALTANSIETPKAVKTLASALETIRNPSDSVAKSARRLGIDFSATALRSKGLAGFLEELRIKTGGSEEAIRSLFNNKDDFNTMMVLLGKGTSQFTEALEQMQHGTENLNNAFETVDASPAEKWGDILNKVRNTGIKLGTALLPVFQKIIDKVSLFVDKFSEMDFGPFISQIEAAIDRIFASIDFDKIVKGIGDFFKILSGVVNLLIPLVEGFWKIKNVIGIIGIGSFAVKRAFDGFVIGSKLVGFIGDLKTAGSLVSGLSKGSYAAQTAFSFVSDRVKNMTKIMQGAQKAGSAIFDIGKMIAGKVATLAMAAAQGIATAATTAWGAATAALNALFVASPIGWIVLGIAALIAVIVLCVKNWDKITAALKIAWEWIKNVDSMVWDKLVSGFKALAGFVKENSEKVLALITIFTGPFGFIISIIKELKDNWGSVVEAFKEGGILGALKQIGGIILSAVLAPIQGLLEILAKIPGVDKLLGPAVEKIQSFRESLKGVEAETTIVQNVVPAEISAVTPRAIPQTTTATAAPAIPSYGIDNRNNRTITAASTPPTRPMTTAEQYRYSETVNREQVEIGVRAEPGTSARVNGRSRSPNVRVGVSGTNNG